MVIHGKFWKKTPQNSYFPYFVVSISLSWQIRKKENKTSMKFFLHQGFVMRVSILWILSMDGILFHDAKKPHMRLQQISSMPNKVQIKLNKCLEIFHTIAYKS